MTRVLDVFLSFLRLGCTSFGGPAAHLAYFRREFVERRGWLDDAEFAQCVALTQLLPGPASSQTGMIVGWLRAGPGGALAAWVAFTLPSAVLMALFARATIQFDPRTGWLHGLLLVATGVVASAILSMRSKLAPDLARLAIAVAVAALVLVVAAPIVAPLAIGLGALLGVVALKPTTNGEPVLDLHLSHRTGIVAIVSFVAAFAALAAWSATGSHAAILVNTLFRVGSLVFGGGHVVLPLLQSQAVSAGILDQRTLLAGYAAAQAMPGPLFTLSSFIGAGAFGGTLGWSGALLATCAIFIPSFFLLAAVAPFYATLSKNRRFRSAIAGANAAVVGLLGAAFVTPIFTSSVHTVMDGAVALAAFAAITYASAPPWIVVILGAFAGYVLGR
jgi:chromate transporter